MLKYMQLHISGFIDETFIYIEHKNSAVHAEVICLAEGTANQCSLYGDEAKAWLEKIEKIHIEDWFDTYGDTESDRGEAWKLEYEDLSEEARVITGRDAYPDNWEQFIDIVSQVVPPSIFDKPVYIEFVFWRITKLDLLMDHEQYIEESIWSYQETMEISREKETLAIHKEIDQESDVTKIYHAHIDVTNLLDFCESCFKNWEPSPIEINDMLPRYDINILYRSGMKKTISANFNRRGLPDAWQNFAYMLRQFTSAYDVYSEMLNPQVYAHGVREGEYIFCSVVFSESGKEYYYQTDDDTLEVGDKVIVPAGRDNSEKEVVITQISYFTKETLPMPLEKVKHILRKAEDYTT